MKTQIINYAKTKEVFEQYKASGYSKEFLAEHEGEIILHKAAKKAFNELGIKKLPSVKSINKEFDEVLKNKKSLYAEYYSKKEKHRELLIHKANVEMILQTENQQKQKNPHEQSH